MFTSRTSVEEIEYFRQENGSIHLAWERLLRTQILDTKDRLGLKIFSAKTEEHLTMLIEDVNDTKYEPDKPEYMYLPKDNKTVRPYSFLTMRDRIVYQAIGNIIIENSYNDLAPFVNKTIFAHIPNPKKWDGSYSEYTFRRTFSSDNEEGQWDKFLRAIFYDIRYASENSMWMMKTDITSFYPSLDHNLIVEMLERRNWLNHKVLLNLLSKCLGVWANNTGQGVPIGHETSELLATLFLLDIDLSFDMPEMMRRYVDDMYFFFDKKDELETFLIEYDLALQKRSLVLSFPKTEIKQCNEVILDDAINKREIRGKHSYIKNIQTANDEDVHQEELQAWFYNNVPCLGSCDELDLVCIRENLSVISFVLWRLAICDENIKQIAMCVLDEFPSKVLQATQYLSNFLFDEEVVECLYNAIFRYQNYSSYHIHCMRTLLLISGDFTQDLYEVLEDWILNSDKWYLRDGSLTILSEYQQLSAHLLKIVIDNDQCYLVRTKAISLLFDLLQEEIDRLDLLKLAFQDSHHAVQSLGVFLYRRQEKIRREHLTSHIPNRFINLLHKDNLKDLFNSYFGYDLPDIIISKLHDETVLYRALKNLCDSASDYIARIEAYYDFAVSFFTAIIRQTRNDYLSSSLMDIASETHPEGLDYETLNSINKYKHMIVEMDGNPRIKVHRRIKYQNYVAIDKSLQELIALDVYNILKSNGYPISITLNKVVERKLRREKNMLTPETQQLAMMFLLNVGNMAVKELSQIWKLRRSNKSHEPDLVIEDSTEIRSVVSELLENKSEVDIKRTLQLVEKCQEFIYGYQNAKHDAEEERNRGDINQTQYKLRIAKQNKNIAEKLAEIESHLSSIGLIIAKEEVK